MAHPSIVLSVHFSNFSLYQISLPDELLDLLSLLKFDSEDRMSLTRHIYAFLHFYESHEIDSEELVCVLFFLTIEGRANRWCHTLSPASIHSLLPFHRELH